MRKEFFIIPLLLLLSACASRFAIIKTEEYNPKIHSRIRFFNDNDVGSIYIIDCNRNKKEYISLNKDKVGITETNNSKHKIPTDRKGDYRIHVFENPLFYELIVPANVYFSFNLHKTWVESQGLLYQKQHYHVFTPTFLTEAGKDYEVVNLTNDKEWKNHRGNNTSIGYDYFFYEISHNGKLTPLDKNKFKYNHNELIKAEPNCQFK